MSLLRLVAYGAQDIYLTGEPQITFFNVVYKKTHEEYEHIQSLKLLAEQNDMDAILELATTYENENDYNLMEKYYLSYIANINKNKLEELIDKFKNNKNISEYANLYDCGADILYLNANVNINENCSICLENNCKYKTQCCGQYFHCACLVNCKTCPLCRNNKF